MILQVYKQIYNYANICALDPSGVPLPRRLRFAKSLQWQLRRSASASLCYLQNNYYLSAVVR
jgi:hypothetical protein